MDSKINKLPKVLFHDCERLEESLSAYGALGLMGELLELEQQLTAIVSGLLDERIEDAIDYAKYLCTGEACSNRANVMRACAQVLDDAERFANAFRVFAGSNGQSCV